MEALHANTQIQTELQMTDKMQSVSSTSCVSIQYVCVNEFIADY